MDFGFIPPPPILAQQVIHEIHQPAAVMETQQHTIIHQIHNLGFSFHHSIVTYPPMYLLIPSIPGMQHCPTLMHSANTASMGDIAMRNLAPKFFAHNIARSSQRVAYIVTYSTTRIAAGEPSVTALYEQTMSASGLQTVITFDVSHFPPPPADLCARFTGVSTPIQEVVRQSPSGMRDLDEVVRLMMSAYDQQGDAGSLLLMVACPGGMHRSVAVAEIIKKKLQRRGVNTVHMNHAHRVRCPEDAI